MRATCVALAAAFLVVGCSDRQCLKSHQERAYMPPMTTMVMAGKVMVPIFHPGYHYMATVCDRWETDEDMRRRGSTRRADFARDEHGRIR